MPTRKLAHQDLTPALAYLADLHAKVREAARLALPRFAQKLGYVNRKSLTAAVV